MPDKKSQIESLLFIAPKPLSQKDIGRLVNAKVEEVEKVIEELIADYGRRGGGIQIMRIGNNFQMSTAPANAELVQAFLKDEMTGELTRPSLETLTIIAYRGPISKPELEQIRGINCGLILRNLMIKGLIEEIEGSKNEEPRYNITFNFMRHLGISESKQLPDYEKLSKSEVFKKILEQQTPNDLIKEKV
jgi:segregation and condensation protein B